MGLANLAVNQLDVHSRIVMHFDPRSKLYTELQWMDDSTGQVMAQIVAHTKGADGTMHNHMSFYTYEPGQPNNRKHHLSLKWTPNGPLNKALVQLDSAGVLDMHNDSAVNHYEFSPDGQCWIIGVDNNGARTATKVAVPQ